MWPQQFSPYIQWLALAMRLYLKCATTTHKPSSFHHCPLRMPPSYEPGPSWPAGPGGGVLICQTRAFLLQHTCSFHSKRHTGRSGTEEALWYSLDRWSVVLTGKATAVWQPERSLQGQEGKWTEPCFRLCIPRLIESTPKQRYPCGTKNSGQVDRNWNNGNHTSPITKTAQQLCRDPILVRIKPAKCWLVFRSPH